MLGEVVAVCSRSFSRNELLRNSLQKQYPNVVFNDSGLQLRGDNLIEYLSGATKAIVGLELIDHYICKQLPRLEVISKYGVGLDNIDLKALLYYKKNLGWFPDSNSLAVAELCVAAAIFLRRRAVEAMDLLYADRWDQLVGDQLSGATVAIVGCGFVGSRTASLFSKFECQIIGVDISEESQAKIDGTIQEFSPLDEALGTADIISIHLPLTRETRNIFDAQKLSILKPEAVVLNAGRGGLIDEVAVSEMLTNGRLRGAYFDVFSTEPAMSVGSYLPNSINAMVTPHIGGSSSQAILSMGLNAIKGLDVYLANDQICSLIERYCVD